MNKRNSIKILMCSLIMLMSCNKDQQIIGLLQSSEKDDVIKGAYMAGESGNKKFAPLLLQNANDFRTSTNIKFKGYSVYQEKMIALKKIFNQEPPVKIINKPDSVIIQFYTALYNRNTK